MNECRPWRAAAALSAFMATAACLAADWPTYLGDNGRRGATADALNMPLTKQWAFKPLHAPRPSWPNPGKEARKVAFDLAFHVAAAAGRVYFASSADDQVYCLDAATGAVRWSAFTGGPIRVAPALWRGRVYVGSDDGRAYCFDAKDGREVWRVRGAPGLRRAVGTGRVVSVWPVRTGVLVQKGVAYFIAGLFPSEGVFVCAADAETGDVLWRNGTSGQVYLQLPHPGAEAFSGVSPQGPLVATDSHLIVSTGRNVPAVYDLKTGALVEYDPEAKYRIGGTYVAADNGMVFNGPAGLTAYDAETGRVALRLPGQRIVLAGDMAYLMTSREVRAVHRERYFELRKQYTALGVERDRVGKQRWRANHDAKQLLWKEKKPTPKIEKLQQRYKELDTKYRALTAEMKKLDPAMAGATKWKCALKGGLAVIATKDAVVVGAAKQVVAIDKASGKIAWGADTPSPVRGLAAAEGRLFASLDSGAIVCFSPATQTKAADVAQRENPNAVYSGPTDAKAAAQEAKRLVANAGVTRGYCVVVGAPGAALPYELARQTGLRVYAVYADAGPTQAARRALARAGVYGDRVAACQAKLGRLPLPDAFANLVVCREGAFLGKPDELLRVLRPCGGVAIMPQPLAAKWFPQGAPKGFRLDALPRGTALTRGPLPGAGEWTHQYATPGNTACAPDRIVRTPLGVRWFGEPGPAKLINRHSKSPAPLFAGGRLFIAGDDMVYAIDAYNGFPLWDRQIKGARRVAVHSEASNVVATADSLYLNVGEQCLRLDAQTGETLAEFATPAEAGQSKTWGYLAVVGGRLFGSTALLYTAQFLEEDAIRSLVRRGVSWDAMLKLRSLGPAVFRNREDFEKRVATKLSPKEFETFKAKLLRDPGLPTGGVASDSVFALDRRTGKRLWTRRIDAGYVHHIAITQGGGRMYLAESPWDSPNARRVVALDERDGKVLWTAAIDAAALGKEFMTLVYSNGVLLALGAQGGGQMAALAADSGKPMWDLKLHFTRHPVVTDKVLYAEPHAIGLKTGKVQTRKHPITGLSVPWQFFRAYGCGASSGSVNCLFFRSGTFGFYDLLADEGTSNWGGQRPGCWMNIVAAGGLVLAPDGSSGCTCSYPLQASIALAPVQRRENWSVFSSAGALRPVKHLAISLGAPGDRRDASGRLWFGYPRPPARRALRFAAKAEFAPGGGYVHRNADLVAIAGTDKPWVFASGARGLRKLTIPLIDKGQGTAAFTVRLCFAVLDGAPGAVDVKVQGKPAFGRLDVIKEAGGLRRALVKELKGVAIVSTLTIEFEPFDTVADRAPLLCGVEIVRE